MMNLKIVNEKLALHLKISRQVFFKNGILTYTPYEESLKAWLQAAKEYYKDLKIS